MFQQARARVDSYQIREKVYEWCEALKAITVDAQFVPPLAYAAMQRLLQHEW